MAHVLLLAGRVRSADRIGHHDYAAGCALLAALLEQSSGMTTTVVGDGWPADDDALAAANVVVFYADGGHKAPLLRSPQRLARIQQLVEQGVGLVLIHQAIRFPPEIEGKVKSWVGGVHVPGKSGRGHWRSHHRELPDHPVTYGVQPWDAKDGWHNQIQFVDGMRGVTPLLWSSAKYAGSREGGAADIVAWAYERPAGGRSFCFTGGDAHSAWSAPGMRQLVVNGIVWSAGLPIPKEGAPCTVDDATVASYLTPRHPPPRTVSRTIRKLVRRFRRAWG